MSAHIFFEQVKKHSSFIVFLMSFLTVTALYPALRSYAVFAFAAVSVIYFLYMLFEKFRHTRKILLLSAAFTVSAFYCAITYASFYPSMTADYSS